MAVKDFIPRPEGSAPDSDEHLAWLDTLRDRQCIDYQLVVSSVSSVDETYLFSVSQNATRKVTVSNLGRFYGTVSSVALAMPSIFSVSGSPVTGKGTITASLVNQTSNVVFAGPSSGASAAPTFRSLVTADLPPGTGTVTSVSLSLPSIFSVVGSPITTQGTITATLVSQNANEVFSGPTTGVSSPPTFRALVTADLPAGTGTVTSVALSLPSIFSVAGSPITTQGTITAYFVSQDANAVFSGPSSGASSPPTFRALVNADLPSPTQLSAPVTVTAGTYTVTLTDRYLVANRAGTITVTLPSAATITGREITIKTISADVASASANVVGQRTTAAATAILEAHVGKWAKLVSDATNWVVMETNDNNALLLE